MKMGLNPKDEFPCFRYVETKKLLLMKWVPSKAVPILFRCEEVASLTAVWQTVDEGSREITSVTILSYSRSCVNVGEENATLNQGEVSIPSVRSPRIHRLPASLGGLL